MSAIDDFIIKNHDFLKNDISDSVRSTIGFFVKNGISEDDAIAQIGDIVYHMRNEYGE